MCYYLLKKPREIIKLVEIEKIETKIDTLYIENQILLTNIKNTKETLNHVEKQYETEYNCITNESTDADVVFFREYLKEQEGRGLFNLDYTNTAKTN